MMSSPSPTTASAECLVALQQGLPLCARPFEALARETGCTEDDLLETLATARREGLVRRFGAVFDVRRLGYRSALCAASVPEKELDAVAARITPLVGVTHCYVREARVEGGDGDAEYPNLWFTLSCPAEQFAAASADVSARVAPYGVRFLPATRRYKVDVVFGAATRAREESVSDTVPLRPGDRAIIGALQGDTEARPDYFAAIARRLGLKEWDLLSTLEIWRRQGRLKRIGLLLHHRHAGWVANGMCCWRIAGDTTAVGRTLAARGEVTHCYERPEAPEFPYNVFAMVHARSHEAAAAQHAALHAEVTRVAPDATTVMLVSTHEYKKTSMTFFTST